MANPQVSALAVSGTSAVFLVLTVNPSEGAAARVRDVCANMPAFVRSVGRRDPSGRLSCVVAIGAEAWERVAPGRTRPAQLHAFRALTDGPRSAPATPGDLLFHIRANRRDFCHELSRIVIDKLGDAVQVIDETHGFAYMDNRDLIRYFAAPLLSETISCLSDHLPTTDVAQAEFSAGEGLDDRHTE